MESGFWSFLVRVWESLLTLLLPQNIDGSCINQSRKYNNDTPSAGEFIKSLFENFSQYLFNKRNF
jgi:hypothetical protein